ncbi:MAG: TolC family protein [Mariniblastus sp.]|nr:TolC family protein [Mariniblastus sp.]
MSWKLPRLLIWTALLSFWFAGCSPSRPLYLHDQGNLSYYVDQATDIEYPDVEVAQLAEVSQAKAPMTVVDPDFESFRDMTLEQVVSISLQNAKILRGYGTPSLQGARVVPGIDNLIQGPAAVGTIYNVAVRETEPGFIGNTGQIADPSTVLTNTGLDVNQGVEAALADFDAQYTTSVFWNHSNEPRNTRGQPNPLEPQIFQQDLVSWDYEFAKKTANGTQLFFRNNNVYTDNNNPLDPNGFQVLSDWYRTNLEFEVRQPLLRGRGAFIQRMPIVISRIGTDQELANMEAQLQNMVTNIEIRYWDLYSAYRNLDAAKTGRKAALETWRILKDQFEEGADVNIQQVAQAGEQYYFFDSSVIEAYNNLLVAESNLRWLMGIAATDGQVIRPTDEASMAPIEFDWDSSLDEALVYRPELRQERWEIKKKELSLAYAKNSLLPQLNVTGLYRWLGLGKDYAKSGQGGGFPGRESGAWNELMDGDFQEFALGVDYRLPIGFRRELSNVRNAQLKLAREIARLEDMELDAARELSDALRAIAANQRLMHSAFNRWKETTIEEEHFEEIIEEGLETLDVALDAQRRRAQSEVAFYNALTEYNKSLALAHRRMGTVLVYNNISMAEGPWAAKAYQDAFEYSRRRGASHVFNYGWTRPGVISLGPVDSAPVEAGGQMLESFETIPLQPVDSFEEIPTPAPRPVENREPTPAQPVPSDSRDPVTLVPLPGGTRALMTFEDPVSENFNSTPAATTPVKPQEAVPMTAWVDDFEQPVERASRVIRRAALDWDRLGGRAEGEPSKNSSAVIRKLK